MGQAHGRADWDGFLIPVVCLGQQSTPFHLICDILILPIAGLTPVLRVPLALRLYLLAQLVLMLLAQLTPLLILLSQDLLLELALELQELGVVVRLVQLQLFLSVNGYEHLRGLTPTLGGRRHVHALPLHLKHPLLGCLCRQHLHFRPCSECEASVATTGPEVIIGLHIVRQGAHLLAASGEVADLRAGKI